MEKKEKMFKPGDEMYERGKKAALRYLVKVGCDIIISDDEECPFNIVVEQDGEIHCVDLYVSDGFCEEPVADRSSFERRMVELFSKHVKELDKPVKLDNFTIMVLDGERALVRRHLDCLKSVDC